MRKLAPCGWQATTGPIHTKITEHQRFAAWLRARVTPSIGTSTASPDEVAGRIAARVKPLLPGPQPRERA